MSFDGGIPFHAWSGLTVVCCHITHYNGVKMASSRPTSQTVQLLWVLQNASNVCETLINHLWVSIFYHIIGNMLGNVRVFCNLTLAARSVYIFNKNLSRSPSLMESNKTCRSTLHTPSNPLLMAGANITCNFMYITYHCFQATPGERKGKLNNA